MLRLADLLAEEPFALALLKGGPEAAAHKVRGAAIHIALVSEAT